MLNYEKIGQQIALLRKEKGFTGERLAELLGVSPQAISKWENGKCLPETALLLPLAKALDCSIDSLLVPKELVILEAVYTDGINSVNITQIVNNHVLDNKLSLCVNEQFIGMSLDSDRLKVLTLKYQTPCGTYYTLALQNELLFVDLSVSQTNNVPYKLIAAYYGSAEKHSSTMQKMEHYEYFKWDKIVVNHELFPSTTSSNDTEYLTLIYLNKTGIHVISCAEDDTIYYDNCHTSLYLKDSTKCILPGIEPLEWGKGMDCPWAGSLYLSLKYMGEDYSYEQLMGMSGACYRICFVDVWDWSCTDALVSYDYATPLYNAIGYTPIWANRIEKSDRKAERLAIMNDLQKGKPVIAINLRIAPEWGVITGYIDNGNEFLCRTYFDKEIFQDFQKEDLLKTDLKRMTFEEHEGYLVNDFWPFLITHFGEKKEKPSFQESLITSLKTLISVFNTDVKCDGGYYNGRDAYEAWIKGLSDDNAFYLENDHENVLRRLSVNDCMILNLIDARRSAEKYLRESINLLPEHKQKFLLKIADNYKNIYDILSAFKEKVNSFSDTEIAYNSLHEVGVSTHELRQTQISVLKNVLLLEEENARLAGEIVE